MNKIFLFTLILISSMFFGCSTYFAIGADKGYCEEHGCDYSDAGLCLDPYELNKHKNKYKKEAYANIDCHKCNAKATTRIVYEK